MDRFTAHHRIGKAPNKVGLRARLLAGSLALSACEPYGDLRNSDVSLGAVDPVTFPAASLGTRGNRSSPGLGTFIETVAQADGTTVGYFAYPFPTRAVSDPLRLLDDGKPYPKVPLSANQSSNYAPVAYSFTEGCTKPPGWTFDPKVDEVALDVQSVVFTELPEATYQPGVMSVTNYLPVVTEVPKSTNQPCQKYKTAKNVKAADEKPSGKFFAWAVIDPANGVYKYDAEDTDTGIGLQKWGWFNRYLLAYLDGGEVPTVEAQVTDMATMSMKTVVRMKTQRLYYPRSMVMSGTMMAAGRIGAGYDVLAAKKGDGDYSPVCEVFTYDAGMPMAAAALPKTAEAIEQMFMASLMPATPRYVFCLQVR
jgi:hypothetical protein